MMFIDVLDECIYFIRKVLALTIYDSSSSNLWFHVTTVTTWYSL